MIYVVARKGQTQMEPIGAYHCRKQAVEQWAEMLKDAARETGKDLLIDSPFSFSCKGTEIFLSKNLEGLYV